MASTQIKFSDNDSGDVDFFLVGCERSGTTLFREVLSHHHSICRCEEFNFAVDALPETGLPTDLTNFHSYLETSREFKLSGFELNRSLKFDGLLRDFMKQRQLKDKRPVVGATVHHQFDRLIEIWPDAKFIFLRRDPRDVSRSIINMGWNGNTWHATQRWLAAEIRWKTLKLKLADDQHIEISFEEFVKNSEALLKHTFSFLDLPYDPNSLEIEADTTYKKPSNEALQRWKITATEKEIQLSEACAGPVLQLAGYEPSGLPTMRIGHLAKILLEIQNRLYSITYKIKNFGFPLWFASVVSRRLPFKSFEKSISLKTDEIINSQMK